MNTWSGGSSVETLSSQAGGGGALQNIDKRLYCRAGVGYVLLGAAAVLCYATIVRAQPAFPGAGDDTFDSKLTFKVTLSSSLGGQTFNITMQGPTCVARSAPHSQATDPSGPMGAGACAGGPAGAVDDVTIGLPFPAGFNSGAGVDEIHTRMMNLLLTGSGWTLRAGASAPASPASYGEVESRGGAFGFGGGGADSFFNIYFEIDVPASVAPPNGLTLFNAEALTVEANGLTSLPPAGSTYIHTHSIKGRVMLFDRLTGCFVGWIEEGGHGVQNIEPPYLSQIPRKRPLVFSVDCFAEGLLIPGPCGALGHAPPNDVFALGMATGQGAWGYATEGEIFQSSGKTLGVGPDMTNVDRFSAALGLRAAPGVGPYRGPYSPNPGAPNPSPAPPGGVSGSLGLVPRDNMDALSFGRDRGDTLLFSVDPLALGAAGSAVRFHSILSPQAAAIGGIGVVPSNGGGDPGNEAAGDIYISPKFGPFPPPGWPVNPLIPPTPLLAQAAPPGSNRIYHDEIDLGLQAPANRHSALCQPGAFVSNPGGGGGGALSLGPPIIPAGIGKDLEAKDEIVAASGIAKADAEVLQTSVLMLPTIQDELLLAKVIDRKSGEVVGVALDKSGTPVDTASAQKQESDAYNAIYGKLNHRLAQRLQTAKSDDVIAVAVWLDAPDTSGAADSVRAQGFELDGGRPVGDQADAAREMLLVERSKIYEASNAPTANAIAAIGAQLDYVGRLSPLVCATGTAAQIRQIAALPGIDRVYESTELVDKLGISNSAVQNSVMKFNGHTGAGIVVGVIESGIADFANQYLDHTAGVSFRRGFQIVVNNATGAAAARLQVTFAGSGGNVFVEPYFVFVAPEANAPACGAPSVPSNTAVTNTIDLQFGANCVDAGASLLAIVYTTGGPLTFAGGNWLNAANANLGAVGAADITITNYTGGNNHATWVSGVIAARRDAGDPAFPAGMGEGMAPSVSLLSGNMAGSRSGIFEPIAGGNGTCDTAAMGDDTQMVANGAAAAPGQQLIGLGPNAQLETTVGGDDVRRYGIPGNVANFAAAVEWALTNNAKILNMSIGEPVSDLTFDVSDRFVDHIVYEHFVAVAVAASNECGSIYEPGGGNGTCDTVAAGDDVQIVANGAAAAPGQDLIGAGPNGIIDTVPGGDDVSTPAIWRCEVTSPGLAYNAITVGATDDLNTAALADDIRAEFSCHRDLAGDYEKPEVSAPGTNIMSTHPTPPANAVSPPPGVSGTSFATPHVAGYIANMLSMDGSLANWPETTKAITIASAKRNTYGNAIENLGAVNWDGMEGAGTIWIDKGHEIMNAGHYDRKVVVAGDFPRNRIVSADAGEQFRYAIAWSTHTVSGGTNHQNVTGDTLTADLDVYVYDCTGQLIAWSSSFNNAYEVVAFISPRKQNYRVEIRAFRFDAATEYLGEAWNADDPICEEDNLDALEVSDGVVIDANLDGIPDGGTRYAFFSIKSMSPSHNRPNPYPGGSTPNDPGNLVTPDDILVSPPPGGPPLAFAIYASGVGDIGLLPGDDLDGLVLLDNGGPNGIMQPNFDIALFTLAPGSPSLAGLNPNMPFGAAIYSPGDVFMTSFNGVILMYAPAGAMGLQPTDNVDALDIGGELPPTDPHATPSAPGTTYVDFGTGGSNPAIPASFFGPGSDPFTGRIDLTGLPIDPARYGNASLLVQRSADPSLADDPVGTVRSVEIELVELNLVSLQPITVTFGGGNNPQQWDVRVALSPTVTPLGSLTAQKTHPNGGTFNSTLPVQPFLIFTRVGNPGSVVTLDTGAEGLPPHLFTAVNTPYVHTVHPSLNLVTASNGSFVPGVLEATPGVPSSQVPVEWVNDDPALPSRHTVRPPIYVPVTTCDCPGDLSGNSAVELGDIPLFVTALLNNVVDDCADMDGSGFDDGVDIQPFVAALVNQVVCTPSLGACCLPDATCNDGVTATDCLSLGGQYRGHGTTCSGVTCPVYSCIPPGEDCWITPCGTSLYEFSDYPIPAGFFDPGSEPFTGSVILGGLPIGPFGTDTIVRRVSDLCFSEPLPSADSVPIEIVALSLQSCAPITVNYNGGGTQQWHVAVGLSVVPAPLGIMTVTKTTANGGTFDTAFFIQPRFTFTQAGNPGNVRVLDTGLSGISVMQLDGTGMPWAITPAIPVSACSPGFVPGIGDGDTCCSEQCHSSYGTAPHDHCVQAAGCGECEPTGACCLPGGACIDNQTSGQCGGLGGSFQGGNSTCAGSNCVPIAGACCLINGTCIDGSSPAGCAAQGGIYQGDGSNCGLVTCPTSICIPAGIDCWVTPCGGSNYSFADLPLPNNFFGPGSDPFTGTVILGGQPSGPFGTDTLIQRQGDLCFQQPPPSSATVPIQLVALSLQSCQPITVTYNGGQNPEQWNVLVQLSPIPAPPGSLTATMLTPTGGTFDSVIFVQPLFAFSRVGPPATVNFDTGAQGIPPMQIGSSGAPWTLNPISGPTCSGGWAPGYSDEPTPCCEEVCHSSFGQAPHDHCVRAPDCPQCESNDDCGSATPLPVPSVTMGTNVGATDDPSPPPCGVSTPNQGVWYSIVGTGTTITISTCSPATTFDTMLEVFSGSCVSPICVAGNDDASPSCPSGSTKSTVSFCSQPGVVYLIRVSGWSSSQGTFELSISHNGVSCSDPIGRCCHNGGNSCSDVTAVVCAGLGGTWSASLNCGTNPCSIAPPNDSCFTPLLIGEGPHPFSTISATTDGPSHTAGECQFAGPVQQNVWFQYTAGCSGTLTATTCEQLGGSADFDTRIAIYATTDCSSLFSALVGCNDDDTNNPCGGSGSWHSTATASVAAGQTYLISLGSFVGSSATGSGVLNVTCSPALPGACCFGLSCGDGFDEISCAGGGGVFQGAGTNCGIVTCSSNAGACCYPGGVCSESMDPASCLLSGGSYNGDGSICFESGITFSRFPALPIPDNSPTGVSDAMFVPDPSIVSDVNVTLNIQHTWVGDLCVILQHLDTGTSVNLIARMGVASPTGCHVGSPFGCNAGNLVNVVLDDEGSVPIETQCQPNLTSPPNYTSNSVLALFNGEQVSGTWILTVSDNAASDTGNLNSWSLSFNGVSPCP
ncbi:MAG: S8 family serine peptidase [Phycisphaerae bacterium]|nr:S8 family serine peptidase [Phycisphaerae bacterium]